MRLHSGWVRVSCNHLVRDGPKRHWNSKKRRYCRICSAGRKAMIGSSHKAHDGTYYKAKLETMLKYGLPRIKACWLSSLNPISLLARFKFLQGVPVMSMWILEIYGHSNSFVKAFGQTVDHSPDDMEWMKWWKWIFWSTHFPHHYMASL